MLLKINNRDYSKYLVDIYNINEHKEYNEWNDLLGHKHKDVIRTSVQGTLYLSLEEQEYIVFLTDLQSVKNENIYSLEIYANNLRTTKTINAYIDFYPEIKKDLDTGKKYNIIEVNVEEM